MEPQLCAKGYQEEAEESHRELAFLPRSPELLQGGGFRRRLNVAAILIGPALGDFWMLGEKEPLLFFTPKRHVSASIQSIAS